MNSYLILAKNKEQRESHARELINDLHISLFDITNVENDGSISVETIRNIQKAIFLSPVKGQKKAVVIKNAQTLTIEAQNALLKLLEEPPLHAYIFLIADTVHSFLPTVLSRCTIQQLTTADTFLSDKKYTEEIMHILAAPLAQKLSYAQKMSKDKETALTWLENSVLALRDQMINTENASEANEYAQTITAYQEAYTTLQTTNVNPRFTLENLFLYFT